MLKLKFTTGNGIGLTLESRKSFGLPVRFVIIARTGDGDFYVLELSGERESPVFVYQPGYSAVLQTRMEVVAEDFGQFFLKHVSRVVSRWQAKN